jgi:hypothetical protein
MTALTERDSPLLRTSQAYLSLAMTQRRLAHRAKREAIKWREQGHWLNFHDLAQQSDKFWREAKFHLEQAKNWRPM